MDCSLPGSSDHGDSPGKNTGVPFPSPMHESEKGKWSRSAVSDSSWSHGLQPIRLLCPWDFPGKSTGVGCHCLLWVESLSSVQFSRSVVSNSLRPHESQHARPPCPSPTPRVYLNSCPSSRWCHPAISSSVIPFSSCPQFLPASGSVPTSQLFAWGGQSIGVSASVSVLPRNTQDWSPLGWTGWISLQSKGLSSLLQHNSSKSSILMHSAFFTVQISHPYMTTGKTIALTRWTFVGKVMSLLFNMLSRLVITFLPRSKHLLISWLHHLQW